ncbi:unnamed protein product [Orchesella dallaii]|uniref:Gustatory receptor n=1 Tax=Orchesella dallaii TaxID=48710 RepID=A0ABP1RLL9_9HEXA
MMNLKRPTISFPRNGNSYDSTKSYFLVNTMSAIVNKPAKTGQGKRQNFHIFHWWILCGYYALCFPFKPVTDEDGRCRLKVDNRLKKLCVLIIWILNTSNAITYTLGRMRSVVGYEPQKAGNYFRVGYAIMYTIRHFQFFWVVFTKQREISLLLQSLATSPLLFPENVKKNTSFNKIAWIYMVVMFAANLGAEILVVFFTFSSGTFMASPEKFFDAAITNGKRRFWFDSNSVNFNQQYSFFDIVFGVTELVHRIGYICVDIFETTLSYGPLPFTFWMAAKGFENHIWEITSSAENGVNVQTMQEHIIVYYNNLKHLTRSMNSIWSSMVVLHVMQRALDVIEIHKKISSIDVASCRLVITFVFLAIAVVLMSEGCRVVRH